MLVLVKTRPAATVKILEYDAIDGEVLVTVVVSGQSGVFGKWLNTLWKIR